MSASALRTDDNLSDNASASPMLASVPPNYERERSTLRLDLLEPWMDMDYAIQMVDLMHWTPVLIRIPSPALALSSSPSLPSSSSSRHQRPPSPLPNYLSQQLNNPGYLFLTFPSAADAASVLSRLHAANASQSRGGRPPLFLPNSDNMVELNYASASDAIACWNYHHQNDERRESGSEYPQPASSPPVSGPEAIASSNTERNSLLSARSIDPAVSGTRGAGSHERRTPPSPRSANASLAALQLARVARTNLRSPPSLHPHTPSSASSTQTAPPALQPAPTSQPQQQPQPAELEYSIFVGDLAHDVVHTDLVNLFRNPRLGLREDRPYRFVKPFQSCRSAKIMLDNNTGISRGYGFVRFGDEADQRRALIEMQGMYCGSRPIRISHATAKAKPAGGDPSASSGHPINIDYRTNIASIPNPGTSFGNSTGSGGSSQLRSAAPLTTTSIQGQGPGYGQGAAPDRPTSRLSHASSSRSGLDRVSEGTGESRLAPSPGTGTSFQPSMGRPTGSPSSTGAKRSSSPPTLVDRKIKGRAIEQDIGWEAGTAAETSSPTSNHHHPRPHVVTINDVPPALLAQIAALAQAGKLGDYLAEHRYSFHHAHHAGSELDDLVKSGSPGPPHVSAASSGHARASMSTNTTGGGHHVPPRGHSYVGSGSTAGGETTSVFDNGDDHLNSLVPSVGVTGNSSDPYNTTVFVGGLSALISEETLRSFFLPFGEIHYVKIPPGKGCGFVQFVHKQDANTAIERMQGFAIGGSKIRLSWGRSQYRAAVAAAQATQLGLNMGELQSLAEASGGALPNALLGPAAAPIRSPPPSPPRIGSSAPARHHHHHSEALVSPTPGHASSGSPEHFIAPPSPPMLQHHPSSHDPMRLTRTGSGGRRNVDSRRMGGILSGSSPASGAPSRQAQHHNMSQNPMRSVLGSSQFAPFSPDVSASLNLPHQQQSSNSPFSIQSGPSPSGPASSQNNFVNADVGLYERGANEDLYNSVLGRGTGVGFEPNLLSPHLGQFPQSQPGSGSYQSQQQVFDAISALPRVAQHRDLLQQTQVQQPFQQRLSGDSYSSYFQQPLEQSLSSTQFSGGGRFASSASQQQHDDRYGVGVSNISDDDNLNVGSALGGGWRTGGGPSPYRLDENTISSQGGVPSYRRDYGRSDDTSGSFGRPGRST